jgi:hypothetical protein
MCNYDKKCTVTDCKFKHSDGYVPHPNERCRLGEHCDFNDDDTDYDDHDDDSNDDHDHDDDDNTCCSHTEHDEDCPFCMSIPNLKIFFILGS